MLSTSLTKERGIPLWAIGAPAIGVPLMVALLALTAPARETAVERPGLAAATEQVERQTPDRAQDSAGACTEQPSTS